MCSPTRHKGTALGHKVLSYQKDDYFSTLLYLWQISCAQVVLVCHYMYTDAIAQYDHNCVTKAVLLSCRSELNYSSRWRPGRPSHTAPCPLRNPLPPPPPTSPLCKKECTLDACKATVCNIDFGNIKSTVNVQYMFKPGSTFAVKVV